ncbi:hypothetical protein JW978_03345 [Candidatus Dojkabacteria bacterium]|nr:hypothetical protein [Candidatus Dojkabacteria bacterium]
MTKEELKVLTEKVEKIVREVGDWVLSQQLAAKKEVEKEKGDYATNIDLEAEKRLVTALKALDPAIGFETEEHTNGQDSLDDGLRWVIDPIDGTKNYFRKLPLWSVNVALYDADSKEVLIGVVYLPKFGDMFVAHKDGGSYRNGNQCKPSDVDDPERAIIYCEPPNISRGEWDPEEFDNIMKDFYRVRSWGLGAVLCYIADGGYDAFIDISRTMKNPDILAPILIAEEAGCEMEGFNIDAPITDRRIVVTNGKLVI